MAEIVGSRIKYMFILRKTVTHLILVSSLLISGGAFAKYTEVKRLGTGQAVCIGGVKSASEFQTWTAANKATVRAIIALTALDGEQNQIFDAIAKGQFVEKQYVPGTTFHWMSVKKKGVPTILPERIWAGKKAFVGYEMFITKGSEKYQIVVPKECCNFSLASVQKIEKAPVVIAPAPVTPIAPAAPIVEKASNITPFVALMVGSESLKRYEAMWDMDMQDSSGIAGIKVGAKFKVAEGLSIVPAIGLVHRLGINEGSVYPESSGHIDLGIEKQISDKFFVGAGFGWWNVNKSDYDEASAYINVGGAISKGLDWFVEGRAIDASETGSVYGAGVRMNF